jgi:hypothetical protein
VHGSVSVVTIDEGSYREPSFNRELAYVAADAMTAPTPVVAPDSLQASVTVSIVWEIA